MQTGKNRQFRQKRKTRKPLKINASGSRSGGIIALRLPATDMVATPHCGARFLSVEKGFDEISATGGHRILSPRPFGPEPKIWSVFPVIFSSFRNLPSAPVFAGFFRLFAGISAYFQTGLNWTFGRFLHFYRFSYPLQPPGLHP